MNPRHSRRPGRGAAVPNWPRPARLLRQGPKPDASRHPLSPWAAEQVQRRWQCSGGGGSAAFASAGTASATGAEASRTRRRLSPWRLGQVQRRWQVRGRRFCAGLVRHGFRDRGRNPSGAGAISRLGARGRFSGADGSAGGGSAVASSGTGSAAGRSLTAAGALSRLGRRGKFRGAAVPSFVLRLRHGGHGFRGRSAGSFAGRLFPVGPVLRGFGDSVRGLTGAGAFFRLGRFRGGDNIGGDMRKELHAALFCPGDLLLQRADATLVSALSRLDSDAIATYRCRW